jgi:hypothetical protein
MTATREASETVKLCKDCRHTGAVIHCFRKRVATQTISRLTGAEQEEIDGPLLDCLSERYSPWWMWWRCGPTARHYQPKTEGESG